MQSYFWPRAWPISSRAKASTSMEARPLSEHGGTAHAPAIALSSEGRVYTNTRLSNSGFPNRLEDSHSLPNSGISMPGMTS